MRKSFFNRTEPVITSLINGESDVGRLRERVVSSAAQGADGIAIELAEVPPEARTTANYRMLMDAAPELPFMFILYRNDKWFGNDDEARQKFLLDAADAGAEVIDVMGDLFDPEPYELAVKPEAIGKQKQLIEEIHRRGAKVVMSSHMQTARTPEQLLAHLREQSARGADILKIVTAAGTEDEFLDAVRTTVLLKKELDKPFIQLITGKYARLQRILGIKTGVSVTFAIQDETDTSPQPTVKQFRAVADNIHWPPYAQNLRAAREEAQHQVDSGLIQGAVFARLDAPEDIIAVGNRTTHPPKPMTVHSRFDMASCGKTMTAGCCALLIHQGRLDPDAPFTEYYPEHALGRNCDITIRDLAMHVSGFSNDKPYHSSDRAVFFREIAKKMPERPRGEAFEYSCYNLILLGLILNRLTGKDLDTLAREMIWKPLGMSRTTWNEPGPGPDEVEHWDPNRPAGVHNDAVCLDCGFPLGSGSFFSTAGDMLLFLQDIAARKHFPAVYYDLITQCAYEKNGARRSFGWDMCEEHRPRNFSDKTIFHSGWTGQSIIVDPATGRGGVVLTSRMGDWNLAYAGRVRIMEKLYGLI